MVLGYYKKYTQDFYLRPLLSLTWYHIFRRYVNKKWQTEQEIHLSFKGQW